MVLRRNLLIVIILALLFGLAVLYLASSTLLLQGFARVEKTTTAADTLRVKDALDTQLTDLDRRINDWANWDDSWLFVAGQEPDFPDGNLQNNALQNLDINFLLYANAKGELLQPIKAIDLDKANQGDPDSAGISLPPDLKAALSPSSPLFVHKGETDKKDGILNLADKPVLLAVRPQIHSDGSGPIAGTIIFGRLLDKTDVGKLSSVTHIQDITITPLTKTLTAEQSAALKDLQKGEKTHSTAHQKTADGYALVNDIFGKPKFLLQISEPRTVYQQGLNSLLYFIIAILAIGVVFTFVVLFLLEGLILRQVRTLSNSAIRAANQRDYSNRLPVNGNDEFAQLTSSLNKVLDELQFSQQARQELERLRTLAANTNNQPKDPGGQP